jgi:hypothetical protein
MLTRLTQLATPVINGSTYTYSFGAVSQGYAASVSVSVPSSPVSTVWAISVSGTVIATSQGANTTGPIYLGSGDVLSVTGQPGGTFSGVAVMTGVQGPPREVPSSTPSSSSNLTVAGTVDVSSIAGTVIIDANSSTVTIGPGPVSYVTLPTPSAGADWAYTYPKELRLVGVRAVLTTGSAPGRRYPYLWQVLDGDTLPTSETFLSPDSLGPNETIVCNAIPGGAPSAREDVREPASGGLPTSLATIYTAPPGGYLANPTIFLTNTTGTAVVVTLVANGTTFFDESVPANSSVALQVPNLQAATPLEGQATASGITYILSGTENGDNRRVCGFSGLLMPTSSSVQSATGGLQSGDQWSSIQLAFTEN